jgi:hypothetical protein
LTACAALLLTACAARAETLNAYAAPNAWGPVTYLEAYLGPVTYTVRYEALGKTVVVGEVTYEGPKGRVVKEFNGSVTFRTHGAGRPSVRFKGLPLGSAVRVTISP